MTMGWQTEFQTIRAKKILKGAATCNIIQLSSEWQTAWGQAIFQEQLLSLNILLMLNAMSLMPCPRVPGIKKSSFLTCAVIQ